MKLGVVVEIRRNVIAAREGSVACTDCFRTLQIRSSQVLLELRRDERGSDTRSAGYGCAVVGHYSY